MRVIAIVVGLSFVLAQTGCIMSYREDSQNRRPGAARAPGVLYYRVSGGTIFSGEDALRETIERESPFAATRYVASDQRNEAEFLDVDIDTLRPSTPALVFGYVSYATLAVLPFWSTRDGYRITFERYEAGALAETKTYDVHRSTFCWLVVLPVAWITLLLPSEADAVKAVTRDYLATLPSG